MSSSVMLSYCSAGSPGANGASPAANANAKPATASPTANGNSPAPVSPLTALLLRHTFQTACFPCLLCLTAMRSMHVLGGDCCEALRMLGQ